MAPNPHPNDNRADPTTSYSYVLVQKLLIIHPDSHTHTTDIMARVTIEDEPESTTATYTSAVPPSSDFHERRLIK